MPLPKRHQELDLQQHIAARLVSQLFSFHRVFSYAIAVYGVENGKKRYEIDGVSKSKSMMKRLAAYKLGFNSDHFIAAAEDLIREGIGECRQYAVAAKWMLDILGEMEDALTAIAVDAEPGIAPMVFQTLKTLGVYANRLTEISKQPVEHDEARFRALLRIPFIKTWQNLMLLTGDLLKDAPHLSCWAKFGSALSSSSREPDGTLSDPAIQRFQELMLALSALPESLVTRIKVLECLLKEAEKNKSQNPVVLVHAALEVCRQAPGGWLAFPNLAQSNKRGLENITMQNGPARPIRLRPDEVTAPTGPLLSTWLTEVHIRLQSVLEFLPDGHDLSVHDTASGEPCATLDGIAYVVTSEQQLILRVLLDSCGKYVTANEIQKHGGALLQGKRIGKHVRELPKALTDLIKTARKKGGGFSLSLD